MPADEQVSRAQALRKERRFQDAFAAAQQATQIDPKNADAWWQMGLNAHSLNQTSDALTGFRETVRLAPRFAQGWAYFGASLVKVGKQDEAEKALLQALRAEADNAYALRLLADLYREKKDEERQLRVLLQLDGHNHADSDELNRIGIIYHNQKNFGAAIRFYRRSATGDATALAPRFNLGLVYNDSELSQDIDAADAWAACLRLKPDHERARKSLEALVPKLQRLAESTKTYGATLLKREEWFQYYLNPFELLGVDHASTTADELDPKTLQRLKKVLLQEIKLEGHVSWLDAYVIETGRVEDVCKELSDESRRRFHWWVFQDRRLLRFLTRGEHAHFTYSDASEHVETANALESDDAFREWLSPTFGHQYGLVLGRAMERNALPVIEALCDGRRWVEPGDDDRCYEAAHRHVRRLVEPLRLLAETAKDTRPEISQLERHLDRDGIVPLLNLLPLPFRDIQSETVSYIRDIAIACHNVHSDSDLSRSILHLSKKFTFKNRELNDRLAEDFNKIEELIREQRKHEAKLTNGSIPWEVTKDGVRQGDRFLAVAGICSIRWGILVSGNQYAPSHEFLMAFRDGSRREVVFSWTATQNLDKQQEHFNSLVQAALAYIAPVVIGKVSARLERGEEERIGTCVLRKDGVIFETQGWIFSKKHIVPWSQVGTAFERGYLAVFNLATPKVRTLMPLRETENAMALHFLSKS